jgi:hypothetical protein
VINPPTRESQTGLDIRDLKIWKFLNHRSGRKSGSQQIEDIRNAHTHSANTRTAPTLAGVDSNAVTYCGHIQAPIQHHPNEIAAGRSSQQSCELLPGLQDLHVLLSLHAC